MKELVIYTDGEIENILLLEDGVLTEKYKDSKYKKRLEGNIYIGKVQNILPGLQAAFVNVGENKNAFIHLKDVLPKVDITKNDANEWENQRIEKILKVLCKHAAGYPAAFVLPVKPFFLSFKNPAY